MRFIKVIIVCLAVIGCSNQEKIAPNDGVLKIPTHLKTIEPSLAAPVPIPSPAPKAVKALKAEPTPTAISPEEADELIQTREDLWKELIGE